MLSIKEIEELITADKTSARKTKMKEGVRYYEAKHDILDYEMFWIDAEGNPQRDLYRSNIRISHPFFTELVDQQVQYMLSGPSFVSSKDERLNDELSAYFDDKFISELQETLTDTTVKGSGTMYAYMGRDGKSHFLSADSMGVIDVRAEDTDDGCDYVIYHYLDRVDKGRKTIERIEVWDKDRTWYYVREDGGTIEPDDSKEINPRPHIVYSKGDNDTDLYYEGNGGYGFIPFFRLDNNRKQTGNLAPVKDLIDDYDLMACGLSNNLQDIQEGIYVIKGYQGSNLEEMIQNIRVKKAVRTSDTGDVDIKTIDVPYEARKTKLELDEKNIYRFGMGFNSSQVGDGNITNIVIKSRYALLDLKCNKLEIRLKSFLRQILDVVLDEINAKLSTGYTQEDIKIEFSREVMTNASDNAQIDLAKAQTKTQEINNFLNAASIIGNDTALKGICEILDLDYDEIKEELKKENSDGLNEAVEKMISELGSTTEDEGEQDNDQN